MVQIIERIVEVKKYYCDGCGKELTDEYADEYSDNDFAENFSVKFSNSLIDAGVKRDCLNGRRIEFIKHAYNGKDFTDDFKDILFCKECSSKLVDDIFQYGLDKILKIANKEGQQGE